MGLDEVSINQLSPMLQDVDLLAESYDKHRPVGLSVVSAVVRDTLLLTEVDFEWHH
jgi:hypothetical protein